jgi:hypothetical protein
MAFLRPRFGRSPLVRIAVTTPLLLVGTFTATQLAGMTPAFASCPYQPNHYAGGTDGVGSRWGVQGYISAHSESVPKTNANFTDEAVHAIGSSNGLEVGWYVGYGNQTGTYVTYPHVYATLNGPAEKDGPEIPTNSDYYYVTWWSGSTDHYHVVTTIGGSYVFSGTISTGGETGPGTIVAVGETDNTALPLGPSTLRSLQHLYSNGTWYDWSSTTVCADSPYYATKNSDTSVSNG